MDYFSYKHFYVLYCRFWELDTDHDGIISKYAHDQQMRRITLNSPFRD